MECTEASREEFLITNRYSMAPSLLLRTWATWRGTGESIIRLIHVLHVATPRLPSNVADQVRAWRWYRESWRDILGRKTYALFSSMLYTIICRFDSTQPRFRFVEAINTTGWNDPFPMTDEELDVLLAPWLGPTTLHREQTVPSSE